MEILDKVTEEKLEQHLNPSPTSTQDLPYTKERIAMMSLILQRMLAQTGILCDNWLMELVWSISYIVEATQFLI